jgi:hypothetical protein
LRSRSIGVDEDDEVFAVVVRQSAVGACVQADSGYSCRDVDAIKSSCFSRKPGAWEVGCEHGVVVCFTKPEEAGGIARAGMAPTKPSSAYNAIMASESESSKRRLLSLKQLLIVFNVSGASDKQATAHLLQQPLQPCIRIPLNSLCLETRCP